MLRWKAFVARLQILLQCGLYQPEACLPFPLTSSTCGLGKVFFPSVDFKSSRLTQDVFSLQPPCEHILVNFLAAHLTKLPPVKVRLGVTISTIFDEFSENFQTASDPRPHPIFGKLCCAFCNEIFRGAATPPLFFTKKAQLSAEL